MPQSFNPYIILLFLKLFDSFYYLKWSCNIIKIMGTHKYTPMYLTHEGTQGEYWEKRLFTFEGPLVSED